MPAAPDPVAPPRDIPPVRENPAAPRTEPSRPLLLPLGQPPPPRPPQPKFMFLPLRPPPTQPAAQTPAQLQLPLRPPPPALQKRDHSPPHVLGPKRNTKRKKPAKPYERPQQVAQPKGVQKRKKPQLAGVWRGGGRKASAVGVGRGGGWREMLEELEELGG